MRIFGCGGLQRSERTQAVFSIGVGCKPLKTAVAQPSDMVFACWTRLTKIHRPTAHRSETEFVAITARGTQPSA
jgi:hypothetical protein